MKLAPIAAALALIGGAAALAFQPQTQPPSTGAPKPPSVQDMGAMLVQGLKATPGCLGVEAAQTQSKKNVIFAWFENKAAAMAWYNSPVHKVLRRSAAGAGLSTDHEPMAGVPDDVPVMAVACLKMAGEGEKPLPGMSMPVTEISIELYAPLSGGIRYGGGFAPEAFKAPGRTDIPAPPPEAAPDAPASPTGPAPEPKKP